MPDEEEPAEDSMASHFLNLSPLQWEERLPGELQPEYDRLFDLWAAARRACHGPYGAAHDGARRAEDNAWGAITWYCHQHGYMSPSVGVLRDQVDAGEAEISAN